jgi:hypothetical protein
MSAKIVKFPTAKDAVAEVVAAAEIESGVELPAEAHELDSIMVLGWDGETLYVHTNINNGPDEMWLLQHAMRSLLDIYSE